MYGVFVHNIGQPTEIGIFFVNQLSHNLSILTDFRYRIGTTNMIDGIFFVSHGVYHEMMFSIYLKKITLTYIQMVKFSIIFLDWSKNSFFKTPEMRKNPKLWDRIRPLGQA